MKVFCSDLLVDVVVNRIVGKYQFSWEVLREDWRSAGWRYLPNLHLVRKTQRVAAVDKAGDAFAEKPSGPIYFDIPSIDIPCTIYWYTIDPKNRFFRFRFFFFSLLFLLNRPSLWGGLPAYSEVCKIALLNFIQILTALGSQPQFVVTLDMLHFCAPQPNVALEKLKYWGFLAF